MSQAILTAPFVQLEELNHLFIELTAANCNLRCKHCYLEFDPYKKIKDFISIDKVKKALVETKNEPLKCVYLTGGEPMLQAKAFCELANMIKTNPKYDIWCYTGYLFEDIVYSKDDKYELLKQTDVLIDGLYIDELRDISLAFRGSSNQRIIDVQESLKQNTVIEWKNNN